MPLGFDDAARAELAAGGRRVAQAGLVVGSAGNLSLRSDDRVLISRRGVELDAMGPWDCVEVGLDGEVAGDDDGRPSRPSSELPLHVAIYRATDAGAIVHTHSHYATVLGTITGELPAVHYTINQFGGPIRVARYECFGTEELATSVIQALQDRSGALMANHGSVVIAADIERDTSKAILLEWLASVYYHAMLGGRPNILGESELDAVRERVRQLDYAGKAQR